MRFPWGFDEEDKFCSKMKTELAQQIMVLRQRGAVSDRLRLRRRSVRSRDRQWSAGNHRPRPDAFLLYTT